jgi:hypothetical protein
MANWDFVHDQRGKSGVLTHLGFVDHGIYRTARGDGTIQVPPDVPDQTYANFVLNVVG